MCLCLFKEPSIRRFQKRNATHTPPPSLSGPLPLLVSSCPGWVVYSEKTHGEEVLPFLSRVRSPQGIMGALVKRLWCRGRSLDPARYVYFHRVNQ